MRDIRNAYRQNYRILSTESAREALAAIAELKQKNEVVAMFISDQRIPEMLGVEFLNEAKKYFLKPNGCCSPPIRTWMRPSRPSTKCVWTTI